MFERYTEQARRAIFHARYEALGRGAVEIETRDIVIGVLRELDPNGPLAQLRDNAEAIRTILDSGTTFDGPGHNQEIALSKGSKKALANADSEGRRDGGYSIGAEHLLRGVLLTGDETAKKMSSAGYRLSTIRNVASRREIPTIPSQHWWFNATRRRLFFIAIFAATVSVLLYLHLQN